MNQEEKQLLLKDFCARLPYGVKVQYDNQICKLISMNGDDGSVLLLDEGGFTKPDFDDGLFIPIEKIKPYLYPESEVSNLISPKELSMLTGYELYDWFHKNHIAYRTLNGKDMFELGLAVRATKEMYNN